jgi:PHD/YefM family antitoxin component YafN of YafNO toxin-antitoxin module
MLRTVKEMNEPITIVKNGEPDAFVMTHFEYLSLLGEPSDDRRELIRKF